MSGFYGVNYRINGHRVGFVQALNGVYRVIFERCYEENTLEAVEAIDWQNVTVEQVRTDYPACPLPEGYTFSVQEIEYTKQGYFTVILKTDKQHWGDVTPYREPERCRRPEGYAAHRERRKPCRCQRAAGGTGGHL